MSRQSSDNSELQEARKNLRYIARTIVHRYSRSSQPRGDFLDAFRRIQSRQQEVLRTAIESILDRYGINQRDLLDTVTMVGGKSRPGVTQVFYDSIHPDRLTELASWTGLQSEIPHMGIFEGDEQGPDAIYWWESNRSGNDLIQELNEHQIPNRIISPQENQRHLVIVIDQNRELEPVIQQYVEASGIPYETAKGRFRLVGGQSLEEGRENYRSIISQSEQLM